MGKVFVLGLDGLEYNFVDKWNLSNLLQEQNGKIEVPINKEVGQPLSPQVWGSFLLDMLWRRNLLELGFGDRLPRF